MKKTVHAIYIWSMTAIVILVTTYVAYYGYDYYVSPIEERFYLPMHDQLKPSGSFGHGLGIIGTAMIVFGVGIYIARKRYRFMAKYLRLKYLLEFHIFLCVLGPILILFHTAFKFGGMVSIAFWSMVLVVLSGVIGRFIYIQIPRTIKGRELSLGEVKDMKTNISDSLASQETLDSETIQAIQQVVSENESNFDDLSYISKYFMDKKSLRKIRKSLKAKGIARREVKTILNMVREEISLSNKIRRLQTMQNLFKYWHVAHLPFALIMLIILVVHVGVTVAFGYKWMF
tara:strand:+ start:56408 stop:57268 length:861 start_codon:yes stop_codon:yes gene_type:complete